MNSLKKYPIYVLGLLGLWLACSSPQETFRYDYTYLYDEDQKLIKPQFKIFHHAADSSTLYFKIHSHDILYGRLGSDSNLTARILVKYKLYDGFDKKNILDSATYPIMNKGLNEENKVLQSSFRFKAPAEKVHLMEIRFRDENKDINVANEIVFDKRANQNSQYFLLKDGEKVIVDHIVKNKKPLTVLKSPLIGESNYQLERTNIQFDMTPPPFITEQNLVQHIPADFKDSVEFQDQSIVLNSYFKINRLNSDSLSNPLYFYYFYEDYPKLTKVDQMIDPIRYISTNSEYKNVKNSINAKKAIDDFWLNLLKDEDKARKVIKTYYNRIEDANRYFTDYREGWKTDRGIIYVIFGEPTTVYKKLQSETWIYGEEGNILSLTFQFYKSKNPISDNEFVMVRNSDYKSNWYRAVDLWRQGKIN